MTNTDEKLGMTRNQIAWVAAQKIPNGSYVNLGIGFPELIANHVPSDKTIIYHTENGVLGFGPMPDNGDDVDYDLINAGKKPISLLPGASFFNHADSFSMIRGGHLDICFLGAMQIAQNGDIANWSTGSPKAIPAVGGAMDLVNGVKNIQVLSEHVTKKGDPKLVEACTFPLTGKNAIKTIYTNLGVFHPQQDSFLISEIAPNVELATVEKLTGAKLIVADDLTVIELPDNL